MHHTPTWATIYAHGRRARKDVTRNADDDLGATAMVAITVNVGDGTTDGIELHSTRYDGGTYFEVWRRGNDREPARLASLDVPSAALDHAIATD